jgi:tRNA 2-thiouridine synthesizing protein A
MTTIDVELDVKGLNCPMPLLKSKKALAGMLPGQVLRVISTDKGSVSDMAAFCRQTGHELLEQSANPTEFVFVIRRKSN